MTRATGWAWSRRTTVQITEYERSLLAQEPIPSAGQFRNRSRLSDRVRGRLSVFLGRLIRRNPPQSRLRQPTAQR